MYETCSYDNLCNYFIARDIYYIKDQTTLGQGKVANSTVTDRKLEDIQYQLANFVTKNSKLEMLWSTFQVLWNGKRRSQLQQHHLLLQATNQRSKNCLQHFFQDKSHQSRQPNPLQVQYRENCKRYSTALRTTKEIYTAPGNHVNKNQSSSFIATPMVVTRPTTVVGAKTGRSFMMIMQHLFI